MKLSRLFRRKQEDAPLALAPPPALPISGREAHIKLRGQFQQAMYGVFFCTRTYRSIIEGESVWREAVYLSDFGWQVQTLSREQGPDGKALIRCAHVNQDKGMNFIEAVQNLSIFEHTTQSHSGIEMDAGEVAQLGATHVRAFAEREGLIFDIHGMAHATLDGRLVSEGLFDEDSRARAIENASKRHEYLSALPTISLPVVKAVRDDVFAFHHDLYITSALGMLEKFVQIINREGWVAHRADGNLENNWSYSLDGQNYISGKMRGYYSVNRDVYNKSVSNAFVHAKPCIAGYRQAFDMVALYGHISVLNHLRRHLGRDEYYFRPDLAISYKKRIEPIMKRLGIQKYTPESLAIHLQNDDNRYDAELSQIMGWAKDTHKLFRDSHGIVPARNIKPGALPKLPQP